MEWKGNFCKICIWPQQSIWERSVQPSLNFSEAAPQTYDAIIYNLLGLQAISLHSDPGWDGQHKGGKQINLLAHTFSVTC